LFCCSSSSTTAVDIPSSNPSLPVSVPPQHGSNGSSIGSGIGGDESSSVSSFDDYLLDNDTSSSGYTQEEQEELTRLIFEDDFNQQLLEGLFDNLSPLARLHHQLYQSRFNDKQTDHSTITIDNEKWIEGIIQAIQTPTDNQQKITTNDTSNSNKKQSSNGNKIF
jgi:hypothetical protein